MKAKLTYNDALEVYSRAMLHEMGREEWLFWSMLNSKMKLIAWEETLRVLLIAEEFEKAQDIKEEMDKLK